MSKQELARQLIQLGDTRSFNTLRKYDLATLESLMQERMSATQPTIGVPAPVANEPAPYIPTDAELMRGALPVAPDAPVPVESNGNRWLALALAPLLLLRGIIGA